MDRRDKEDPNETIIYESTVGQRLSGMRKPGTTFIVFQGKRIPLAQRMTIGRGRGNTIILDDILVSRDHAIVQKIRDQFFIEDLGSTNGTFVNGKRIPPDKYVRLNASDTILIGRTELSVIHFR